jgi:O-antigen/teichoic acid export membrane protein
LADSILTRARPLLVARLAGAVLTLGVPMVLARVLVPAEYGTFKQAWLIAQTLAMVLPMGLTQSLYYFLPRDPLRRDAYVAQTLWAHLALGAAAALLVLAGAPLVDAKLENPELTRNLPWVAAITGLQLAGAPLDVAWNASGRIGRSALARVATELVRAAAILAGAAIAGSVEAIFAGIAGAHALRAIVTFVALARAHGLAVSVPALRRQAAYALPFGVAFLLIVPQQQFHQYAVAATASAAVFAVYSVGTLQLPLVDILYTPVSELLQIGIAEKDGAGGGARGALPLFHEAVLQLAFVFVPLTGALFVVAPDLIALLFSDAYAAAGPIFRITALSVVLAALPLDGVMRARAQNRFMLGLSGVKLGVTVALVWGGLELLGPIGAISGFVVAEAATRVVMLARTAALFEVPLRGVLPLGPLARQAAATSVAMLAAWVALHAVHGHLLGRLLLAGAAFTGAYLGLSWARGWLPAGWVGLFRVRRPQPAAATTPEN